MMNKLHGIQEKPSLEGRTVLKGSARSCIEFYMMWKEFCGVYRIRYAARPIRDMANVQCLFDCVEKLRIDLETRSSHPVRCYKCKNHGPWTFGYQNLKRKEWIGTHVRCY